MLLVAVMMRVWTDTYLGKLLLENIFGIINVIGISPGRLICPPQHLESARRHRGSSNLLPYRVEMRIVRTMKDRKEELNRSLHILSLCSS